jgi:CRP-like cAMP-binding protein/voltage-gated potassium channel Kch
LTLSGLVIYSVIVIPYEIGLEAPQSHTTVAVNWFITSLFAVDILLTFNTAYEDPVTEKLIFERSFIAENYAKFWLWVDILATLPFDSIIGVFAHGVSLSAIRAVRILRLIRLVKIYHIFSENEQLEDVFSNPAVFSLIVLLLQIFYVAHLFACFWHFIALPQAVGSFPITWIEKFGFSDYSIQDRYIAALYYVLITMTTVGYGDISASNEIERLFAIMMMLTGAIVFGALVGKVTSLIDKRNPQAKAFKERMDEFKCFLADCKIPSDVAERAKGSYFYYLSQRSAFGEAGIFSELPRGLLKQLISELYRDDIEAIPYFRNMESAFVIEMVTNASPFSAYPDEILFNQGDVCHDIIFVKDGSIRIVTSTGNKKLVIGCVNKGNFFGDAEFLKNTTAIAMYQAAVNCHLLSVPHQVMNRAIGETQKTTSEKINNEFQTRYDNLISLIQTRGDVADEDKKKALLKKSSPIFALGAKTKSTLFTFSSHELSVQSDELQSPHDKVESISKQLWIDGEIKDQSTSMHFLNMDGNDQETEGKVRIVAFHKVEEEPLDNGENKKGHYSQHQKKHTRNKNKKKKKNFLALADSGNHYTKEISESELLKMWLINPFHQYKILWDFFVGLLIIYSVLVVPVEIAFNADAFDGSQTLNLVINGFFFIDIILSFFTAIENVEVGALIVHKKFIVSQYLKGWFVIDVVSTIPFDTIIGAASSSSSNLAFTKLVKIIRLFRLLKLARILKLAAYIERIEDMMGISPAVFELIILLVQVFFIVHWVSCLWWGITSILTANPWYEIQHGFFELQLDNRKIIAEYLATFYYILTTMTTVGYGDIRPVQTEERVFCMIIALCGASMFGYMISNVSALISSLQGVNSAAEQHVSEVYEYLEEKNCPTVLQNRIKVHYKRQIKETSAYDVDTIVARLPPHVKTDILSYLYERRMAKIGFFKYIKLKSVAIYLLTKMTSIFYDANEYIFREGEICKEIYFVVSGEALAFRKLYKQKRELSTLPKFTRVELDQIEQLADEYRKQNLEFLRIDPAESYPTTTTTTLNGTLKPAMKSPTEEGSNKTRKVFFMGDTADNSYHDVQPDSLALLHNHNRRRNHPSEIQDGAYQCLENNEDNDGDHHHHHDDDEEEEIEHKFDGQKDQSSIIISSQVDDHGLELSSSNNTATASPNSRRNISTLHSSLKRNAYSKESLDSSAEEEMNEKKSSFLYKLSSKVKTSFAPLAVDTSSLYRMMVHKSHDDDDLDDDIHPLTTEDDQNHHLNIPSRKVNFQTADANEVEDEENRGSKRSNHQSVSSSSDSKRQQQQRRNSLSVGFDQDAFSFLLSTTNTSEEEKDEIIELMHKRKKQFLSQLNAKDFQSLDFKLLGTIADGDFIGHSAFYEREGRHRSSVRAVLPTTVYIFSKSEINKLIRNEPMIACQFQAAMKEAVIDQYYVQGKVRCRKDRGAFMKEIMEDFRRRLRKNHHRRGRNRVNIDKVRFEETQKKANLRGSTDSLPSLSGDTTTNGEEEKDDAHFFGSDSSYSARSTLTAATATTFSEGTSAKEKGQMKKKRLNQILCTDNIYYDSDDKEHDDRIHKRYRLANTPYLDRASKKFVKRMRKIFPTLFPLSIEEKQLTERHRSLKRLQGTYPQLKRFLMKQSKNQRLKRSYSLSLVEGVESENLMSIFDEKRASEIIEKAPEEESHDHVKNAIKSMSLNSPTENDEEIKEDRKIFERIKFVRRQSFPSYDHIQWRREKMHDFFI